jgi:hypothetical protein
MTINYLNYRSLVDGAKSSRKQQRARKVPEVEEKIDLIYKPRTSKKFLVGLMSRSQIYGTFVPSNDTSGVPQVFGPLLFLQNKEINIGH